MISGILPFYTHEEHIESDTQFRQHIDAVMKGKD